MSACILNSWLAVAFFSGATVGILVMMAIRR